MMTIYELETFGGCIVLNNLNLPFFGWMHDAIEDYFYFQMEDQVTIDC
jgi:hypothetical protein